MGASLLALAKSIYYSLMIAVSIYHDCKTSRGLQIRDGLFTK